MVAIRPLDGRVALITGASRGLGKATAEKLASAGARLILCARDPARLAQAAADIKAHRNVETNEIAIDLGRNGSADTVCSHVIEVSRQVDILVCCAGGSKGGRLQEVSEDDWIESCSVKLFGTMALIKRIAPLMKGAINPTIVVLTGSQGFEPKAENIVAAAINGALNAAIKALANDLSGDGIRVLGISPGPFDTDRMRTVIETRSQSLGISIAEATERAIAQVPLKRFGKADELAEIVLFLVGDKVTFLNGTVIAADGGMRRGF